MNDCAQHVEVFQADSKPNAGKQALERVFAQ